MADQTFPPVHTTRTTVTSTNTAVQTNLRYDPMYLRTTPGMLKCIQIVSIYKLVFQLFVKYNDFLLIYYGNCC